jgi:hypothetical protein
MGLFDKKKLTFDVKLVFYRGLRLAHIMRRMAAYSGLSFLQRVAPLSVPDWRPELSDLVSDWYFLRRFRYGCLLSLTAEVFFTWFSPRAIFHVVSQHPPPHFYNSVCWILMTFLSAVTSIALVA